LRTTLEIHSFSLIHWQEAEASVDKSSDGATALKNAILAAELYMKATKLACTGHERSRLRAKCQQLLTRAEQIKQSPDWKPVKEQESLKAPVSQRAISRREEVILLEGSKLNGFIFPPWTSEPEDTFFDQLVNGSSYT
jgi:calpain-7